MSKRKPKYSLPENCESKVKAKRRKKVNSNEHEVYVQAPLWTTNSLILDSVFKFLPTDDLRRARLTCKEWARAGGREFAKRAVVCVTSREYAGRKRLIVSKISPWSTASLHLWECYCFCANYQKRSYVPTDIYCSPRKHVWNSEFSAKTVNFLGQGSLTHLQLPQFSRIKKLELIKVPATEVNLILSQAHKIFEHLKELEFRKVDGATSNVIQQVSTGIGSDKVQTRVTRSSLESLVFEITPAWTRTIHNWDCVFGHTKLKTLQLNCHENVDHSLSSYPDNVNDENSYYGKCLQHMLPKAQSCSAAITDVTLRFELTTINIRNVQALLAQFRKLKKLCLQLRGPYIMMQSFIAGLDDRVFMALDSLQFVNVFKSDTKDFSPVFSLLGDRGFFKKPSWDVRLRAIKAGWFWLKKSKTKLTVQRQGSYSTFTGIFEMIEAVLGSQDYFPHEYNYAFHHIVTDDSNNGINDFEILNEHALFKSFLLNARWKAMQHCVCDTCRYSPRLLVDLPGFRKETGCTSPADHASETWRRTWTFTCVPRPVLAKWRLRLVAEIASSRTNQECLCEWSDVVTRMKGGLDFWHEFFTDPHDFKQFPPFLVGAPRMKAAYAGFVPSLHSEASIKKKTKNRNRR